MSLMRKLRIYIAKLGVKAKRFSTDSIKLAPCQDYGMLDSLVTLPKRDTYRKVRLASGQH